MPHRNPGPISLYKFSDEQRHGLILNAENAIRSFEDRYYMIDDFNRHDVLDDYGGDTAGFDLTDTYALWPHHTLWAQQTGSAIAGTRPRHSTPTDGQTYRLWQQFTVSAPEDTFRGGPLFCVQHPDDPLSDCLRVQLRSTGVHIEERHGGEWTSRRLANFGFETGQTYEIEVEFPQNELTAEVEVSLPLPDANPLVSTTWTFDHYIELSGGTIGFEVGRSGTPLYFDRVYRVV